MSTISVRLDLDSFRTFIDPDLGKDMDFNNMIYAEGAGRHTSKRCLSGTREDILTEIKTWIDSTGEDVERVFWLNRTAGKGKSAIPHTIADWFIERGGPGIFLLRPHMGSRPMAWNDIHDDRTEFSRWRSYHLANTCGCNSRQKQTQTHDGYHEAVEGDYIRASNCCCKLHRACTSITSYLLLTFCSRSYRAIYSCTCIHSQWCALVLGCSHLFLSCTRFRQYPQSNPYPQRGANWFSECGDPGLWLHRLNPCFLRSSVEARAWAQTKPEPYSGPIWGPGLQFIQARALQSQAKAQAFRPSWAQHYVMSRRRSRQYDNIPRHEDFLIPTTFGLSDPIVRNSEGLALNEPLGVKKGCRRRYVCFAVASANERNSSGGVCVFICVCVCVRILCLHLYFLHLRFAFCVCVCVFVLRGISCLQMC